ncbi:hypothetical protein E4K10_30120 [Streptomyces sp. T1317-0309]|nr:hypothetical protein E4K10_30120 [Streptomyces sp. T1317-0309]
MTSIEIEETPFHEPFGPEYLRPAQKDCPDCPCCTAELCERGRASVLECTGHSNQESKGTVRNCPCSAEATKGTLAWRAAKIRAVTAGTERPLAEEVEEVLRQIAAGGPIVDPKGLLQQLTDRRYVTFEQIRPVLTDFGRTYLDARTGTRTGTPVVVHDVDRKARTVRVVVVGYSPDRQVTVPLDHLANSRTGLKPDELPGKVLHAKANCQAEDLDDVVLTQVQPPAQPQPLPPARRRNIVALPRHAGDALTVALPVLETPPDGDE